MSDKLFGIDITKHYDAPCIVPQRDKQTDVIKKQSVKDKSLLTGVSYDKTQPVVHRELHNDSLPVDVSIEIVDDKSQKGLGE